MNSSVPQIRANDSPDRTGSHRQGRHAPSRDWVLASLPWVISLALHGLLIAMAASVIYAIRVQSNLDFLSLTSFDADQDVPLLKADVPTLVPDQRIKLPQAKVEFDRSLTDLSRLDAEMTTLQRTDLSIVGIGSNSGTGLDGLRMLSGDGAGPKAEFFGQTGSGQRIVYVIDRSGSMAGSFDFLRSELKRSIDDLKAPQKFHVILFSGSVVHAPPARLAPAIRSNKRKCFDFLDQIRPEGTTNPVPAMRLAFAQKPDLIFFLTDGEFPSELVDKLRDWNRKGKVRIFTLGYLYAPGADLLRKIAADHGGTYTFVEGQWFN